jgi:hypothetical protein
MGNDVYIEDILYDIADNISDIIKIQSKFDSLKGSHYFIFEGTLYKSTCLKELNVGILRVSTRKQNIKTLMINIFDLNYNKKIDVNHLIRLFNVIVEIKLNIYNA